MATTNSARLTDEVKALVNNALDDNAPIVLAVVNPQGIPVLSYRGSVQAFSDTQLAFWVRKLEGDSIASIKSNPNVAFMYRSERAPLIQFTGVARISENPTETALVFDNSNERERVNNPDRVGVAVIVDLKSAVGWTRSEAGVMSKVDLAW